MGCPHLPAERLSLFFPSRTAFTIIFLLPPTIMSVVQGRRRHLNIILEDRIATNRRDAANGGIPPEMSPEEAAHNLKFSPEVLEQMAQKLEQSETVFQPPYEDPNSLTAKALARSVGAGRNPTGSFAQVGNPSMWEERTPVEVRVPTTNLTTLAFGAMEGHNWVPGQDDGSAPAPATSGAADTGAGTEAPVKTMTWLLPYENGNDKQGKQMARLVNSRRTPNGGFYA